MKVSVCMGVYNGEKYISEQIASILPQLAADDELVISDNHSTDATRSRIEAFNDPRIRVVMNPEFTHLIFNFENALRHATGDVVFLADCDDVWLANKVQTMKSLLESYDLVVSDCTVVNAEGAVLHQSFFQLRGARKGILHNLVKNTYVGCCMAFRRNLLAVALPFPKNIPMHDVWIAILAEATCSTVFCPEQLMLYRRHGANASPTAAPSPNSLFTKLKMRLNLISALSARLLRYRFAQ